VQGTGPHQNRSINMTQYRVSSGLGSLDPAGIGQEERRNNQEGGEISYDGKGGA